MVSCRLQLSPSLHANLLDEFRSMRQLACVYSAAVHLPEAFRQELSTLLLFPGNRHVCVAHDVLGISKEHANENPIKHRNRWHAFVTLYLPPVCLTMHDTGPVSNALLRMSYYSLGGRYNKGMLYCLTASLKAGTSEDLICLQAANCRSRRPRESLKTSYCCAVGALSA